MPGLYYQHFKRGFFCGLIFLILGKIFSQFRRFYAEKRILYSRRIRAAGYEIYA